MALTDIQIKRAKPQDKPYTLNDGQGLSLLINPDGSKGWRFRFRFAGKARLMSFGSYDLVSLAEAREKRDTARKQVANGIDPVEERKAQKLAQKLSTENSFERGDDLFRQMQSAAFFIRYCGNDFHEREKITYSVYPVDPSPDSLFQWICLFCRKSDPFHPAGSFRACRGNRMRRILECHMEQADFVGGGGIAVADDSCL